MEAIIKKGDLIGNTKDKFRFQIKIGYSVLYCGKIAKVIDKHTTHILIEFENGNKLATPWILFKDNEIIKND